MYGTEYWELVASNIVWWIGGVEVRKDTTVLLNPRACCHWYDSEVRMVFLLSPLPSLTHTILLMKPGFSYKKPNPMTKQFLTSHSSPYCLLTETAAGRKSVSPSNFRWKSFGHVVLASFFVLLCPKTPILITSTVTSVQLTTKPLIRSSEFLSLISNMWLQEILEISSCMLYHSLKLHVLIELNKTKTKHKIQPNCLCVWFIISDLFFSQVLRRKICVYHKLRFLLRLFDTWLYNRKSETMKRPHDLQMIFHNYQIFNFGFS